MMRMAKTAKAIGVISVDGSLPPRKESIMAVISWEFRKTSKDKIKRKTNAAIKILAKGHWLKSRRNRKDERSRIKAKA
jgi:hypothetical protein